MILGFKQKFPWGEPTYFKEKILAGAGYGPIAGRPKIHTIRDGFRWKKGMSIQMAYGVRTKNYQQFNKGIDGLQICTSVQMFEIWNDGTVRIDGFFQTNEDLEQLARNDGFGSAKDFFRWFSVRTFNGQIIHWTDFKYDRIVAGMPWI